MTETTVQGHRVHLLGTRRTPRAVLDTWEDRAPATDLGQRVGVVVTFQEGHDSVNGSSGVWDPFIPDQVWATGYADRSSADPVARFHEALRQERERAAERLGGALNFVQR